ncbi:hypothetical protein EV702DRAFT_1110457 [Suillus placidus]|uniref:Uncharacterized protein n=1 Tax=Suillus placidus TaxID=48579 RepID=A0A9P6ZTT3_9AGAM|nr:hypothetical protein EV702DRAFT_1110457 [Suillus placidus]
MFMVIGAAGEFPMKMIMCSSVSRVKMMLVALVLIPIVSTHNRTRNYWRFFESTLIDMDMPAGCRRMRGIFGTGDFESDKSALQIDKEMPVNLSMH